MKPLRLAIMGGCLNSGFNQVSLNSLYHRILAREIEARLDVPVQVRLGLLDTHQLPGLRAETLQLLQECEPDVLIFQLRPNIIWGLFSAFWLTEHGNGLARLRLNPHRVYGPHWPDGAEASLCPMRRFARANRLLGRLLGMEKHARAALGNLLVELRRACESRGTEFFLFSPVFGEWYDPSFKHDVARRLLPWLNAKVARCIDLLNPPALHEPASWVGDGIHLSAAGHAEVARITLESILPVLRVRSNPSPSTVPPPE